MSLYGNEGNMLSLELVEFLSKSAREYCKEKNLPEEVLSELLGDKELRRFVRGLNLKVEVKPCPMPRPEGLDIALTEGRENGNLIVL